MCCAAAWVWFRNWSWLMYLMFVQSIDKRSLMAMRLCAFYLLHAKIAAQWETDQFKLPTQASSIGTEFPDFGKTTKLKLDSNVRCKESTLRTVQISDWWAVHRSGEGLGIAYWTQWPDFGHILRNFRNGENDQSGCGFDISRYQQDKYQENLFSPMGDSP